MFGAFSSYGLAPAVHGAQSEEAAALALAVQELMSQLRERQIEALAVVDFTDLPGNVLELGRVLLQDIRPLSKL